MALPPALRGSGVKLPLPMSDGSLMFGGGSELFMISPKLFGNG